MTALLALQITGQLVCLGEVLSSMELLSLRAAFSSKGLYATTDPWLMRWIVLRMVLALGLGLLWIPAQFFLVLWMLRMMVLWRIQFGSEGADQMNGLVIMSLGLSSFAIESHRLQEAVLWFIAVQAVVSYVTAGVAKLHIAAWRNGEFLRGVLLNPVYGSAWAARVVSGRAFAKALSWLIMVFESVFFGALLVGERGAVVMCALALTFHLVNAVLMGLNLFVWTFLATYPAIIYCAASLHWPR